MTGPSMSRRPDGYPVMTVPSAGYFTKLTARLQPRLPMWVIYRPPTREWGESWVARMHVAFPQPRPTRFVMTHDSLEELRAMLPPFLTRLTRNLADPPEIVEVWL
jgi:hypothetical protein